MSNENNVMAKAVRTFDGEEGFKSPASEPFPVSRQRFADLKANGLVVEANAEAEQKPAAKPSNKAARPHETK
jgi:hypothetical protein